MKKTIIICLLAMLLCSLTLPVYAVTEATIPADEYEEPLVETEEYFDMEETVPELPEETAPDLPAETTLGPDATVPGETAGDLTVTTGAAADSDHNYSTTTTGSNDTTKLEDLIIPIACFGGGAVLIIVAVVLLATSKKKSK